MRKHIILFGGMWLISALVISIETGNLFSAGLIASVVAPLKGGWATIVHEWFD